MQARMKEHQLSEAEINELLSTAKVGHIGTINPEGFPYVLPVHFVYANKKFYIHGLNKGEKIDNLTKNSKVCFEVADMIGLIMNDAACDVNTEYKSVVALGNATLVEDDTKKKEILSLIVGKYTPTLTGQEFPPEMMIATGIIEISVTKLTGKYYQ